MAEPTDKRQGDKRAMTPLYARLPRGPHRLEPGEVAENQRQRMHGAMVEAVATHGYEATSVKQVISLAGVSRRAFYEQFANKQECFLSALELLATRAGQRVGAAYRSHEGNLETRMRAAMQILMQLVADNPKSAHAALVDAPAAGDAGWRRLTKTLLGFERTLATSFARTQGGFPLPEAIARGVVGGLHRVLFTHVHQRRVRDLPSLAEDVLEWMLVFNSRATGRLRQDIGLDTARRRASAAGRLEQGGVPMDSSGDRASTMWLTADAQRVRLWESALEMIALEGFGNLSPLRVVDRAGTTIDAFFGLFDDMEGCALEAFGAVSGEIRQTIDAAGPSSGEDWPPAVRRSLYSLMCHFADHPSHAHALTKGAFEVGSSGIDLSLELGAEVARMLTASAPSRAHSPLAVSGIAGAIWHTLYCHAALQTTDRLPAVADSLTFIVLAPFIGAEHAAEIAIAQPRTRSFARLSERSQRVGGRHSSRAAL